MYICVSIYTHMYKLNKRKYMQCKHQLLLAIDVNTNHDAYNMDLFGFENDGGYGTALITHSGSLTLYFCEKHMHIRTIVFANYV